jgi:hypothetical protein
MRIHRQNVLALLFSFAMFFILSSCSSSSNDPPPPASPSEYLVITSGLTVALYQMDGSTPVEVGSASIPDDGLLDGHAIFGVVRHPEGSWLYVLSLNGPATEWLGTEDWWWGNARIDRFAVSRNGVEYAGLAFAYNPDTHDSATIARCSADNWYPGQVGGCAPVNGIFSYDGARFYIVDDNDDVLHIFQVEDGSGDLTLLWEGGQATYMHGMALHPTEPYLYRGSTVFELLSDDTADRLFQGDEGNYTTYVSRDPADGPDLLFSTYNTNQIGAWSLADPEIPVTIDLLEIGTHQARALAVTESLERAVTVGRNSVATVAFNGDSFTLEEQFEIEREPGDEHIENRSVALLSNDTYAAVAWFTRTDTNLSGFTGGVTIYEISTLGEITALQTLELDRASRVVMRVVLP